MSKLEISELDEYLEESTKLFEKNGYVLLKDVISQDLNLYLNYFSGAYRNDLKTVTNMFWPVVNEYPKEMYAPAFTELLFYIFKPLIEQITSKKLSPTFSNFKIIGPENEIFPHLSTPQCEYTAILTIKKKSEKDYLVGVENVVQSSNDSYNINENELLVFKGDEVMYYAEKVPDSEEIIQIYLHFVDSNGKYSELKYNNRQGMTAPL